MCTFECICTCIHIKCVYIKKKPVNMRTDRPTYVEICICVYMCAHISIHISI